MNEIRLYRAGTLATSNGAKVIARASTTATKPHAPLAVVSEHGAGRVVVLADSDLFGDDTLGEHDHADLWLNLVYWVANPSFDHAEDIAPSAAKADPAWTALKGEIEALRALQNADGSIDADQQADADIEAITTAIDILRPHFPHQADYLDALVADLGAWDFGVPDFTRSLEAFRPDLQREDGIEHLVVFPMYKQSQAVEKVFEGADRARPVAEVARAAGGHALPEPEVRAGHVRGPHVRLRVQLRRAVPGDGERRRQAANHFGAIFCDREAAPCAPSPPRPRTC